MKDLDETKTAQYVASKLGEAARAMEEAKAGIHCDYHHFINLAMDLLGEVCGEGPAWGSDIIGGGPACRWLKSQTAYKTPKKILAALKLAQHEKELKNDRLNEVRKALHAKDIQLWARKMAECD